MLLIQTLGAIRLLLLIRQQMPLLAMIQTSLLRLVKSQKLFWEVRIMNPRRHGISSVMRFMKKHSFVKDTHISIIRYQLSLLSKEGVRSKLSLSKLNYRINMWS